MSTITFTTAFGPLTFATADGTVVVTAGKRHGSWAEVIPATTAGRSPVEVGLVQQAGTAAMKFLHQGWPAAVGAVKTVLWSALAAAPGFVKTCVKQGELETAGTADPVKVAAHEAATEAAIAAIAAGADAKEMAAVEFDGRRIAVVVARHGGRSYALVQEGEHLSPFASLGDR